jgi:hypothetical protein
VDLFPPDVPGHPPPFPYCHDNVCVDACPDGFTNCDFGCVRMGTNENCGSCGNACTGGAVCVNGTECRCVAGQTQCNGQCVDLDNDPQHCGACPTVCTGGAVCHNRECISMCPAAPPPSTTSCDQSCVDLQTDVMNCGACGAQCHGGTQCLPNPNVPSIKTCQCPSGWVADAITGHCRDPQNDPDYCGTSPVRDCLQPLCVNGVCSDTCTDARPTICNRRCTNTMNDRDNCGVCGNACAVGALCVQGVCN